MFILLVTGYISCFHLFKLLYTAYFTVLHFIVLRQYLFPIKGTLLSGHNLINLWLGWVWTSLQSLLVWIALWVGPDTVLFWGVQHENYIDKGPLELPSRAVSFSEYSRSSPCDKPTAVFWVSKKLFCPLVLAWLSVSWFKEAGPLEMGGDLLSFSAPSLPLEVEVQNAFCWCHAKPQVN